MRYLKRLLPFVAVGFILFGVSWHVLSERARKYVQEGISFESAGQMAEAIQSYEWAVQAYTPASSSVQEAVQRLERIASEAEQKGDHRTARRAYQAILSGLSVIEHFAQPYSTNLQNASKELERVERAMMQPPAAGAAGPAGAPSASPANPD